MIRARASLHRDVETVAAFGAELFTRYTGADPLPGPVADMVRAQAPKRVALQFVAVAEPVTWDHGKLGGVY